jgi:hypothetical protein
MKRKKVEGIGKLELEYRGVLPRSRQVEGSLKDALQVPTYLPG